jgi:hypothetical protein
MLGEFNLGRNLLGMQYLLGDLEADDRPTAKPGSHD